MHRSFVLRKFLEKRFFSAVKFTLVTDRYAKRIRHQTLNEFRLARMLQSLGRHHNESICHRNWSFRQYIWHRSGLVSYLAVRQGQYWVWFDNGLKKCIIRTSKATTRSP